MTCDKCAESINGRPGNGACYQCQEENQYMKAMDIVEKIRAKDKNGEWLISDVAAVGMIYEFRADEKEKEDSGQGQLF
jgi:hypothetical protein